MNADKSKGKTCLGFDRGCRAVAETTHHHAFIGVHRRSSAVNLPFVFSNPSSEVTPPAGTK
jgi:hypothetical protein